MIKIHEKSPCCRGRIRHYGKRRRQCVLCQKTWRVWKRKRGRRSLRPQLQSIRQLLSNYQWPRSSSRKLNLATYQARRRVSLKAFINKTVWPAVPEGPLIVIADAMNQLISGQTWTIYFIILRGINESRAVITSPFLREGAESGHDGWYLAFNKLPEPVRKRIVALVCDGRRELVFLAKKNQWLIQRCHFHLLYRVACYTRTGPLSRSREIGIKVRKLINVILMDPDGQALEKAAREITLLLPTLRSKGLRYVLSCFLEDYEDYRTYLHYPQLHLPVTSNSAEVLIGKIRDLQYRAKGFRTIQSLFRWVIALCKYQRIVTCRGRENQPN